MKALTLIQPWATLVALREKKIETRSWKTVYRGPIAIHAGKKIDKYICSTEPYKSILNKYGYTANNLPTGYIVAICNLTDCCQIIYNKINKIHYLVDSDCTKIQGNELEFGDYSDGRYGWKLENVEMLKKPIPAKGALRLWQWSD